MENNELQINNGKGKLFLPISILVAAVMVSGSLVYTRGSGTAPSKNNQEGKRVEVSMDDDPFLGDKSAPVKIIEFSDFQCPFCRKFWGESLLSIKKDFVDTGKAVFVYRDYPLSFHAAANISAQAAQCANDQGKFWEMHDKIFGEEQKKGEGTIEYGVNDIKKWAREISLNLAQFNQCLDSEKYKMEVEKDFTDGSNAGVNGTPSTFINGRLVIGSQPYSVFKEIIEEELKNSEKKKNSFFK